MLVVVKIATGKHWHMPGTENISSVLCANGGHYEVIPSFEPSEAGIHDGSHFRTCSAIEVK